MPTTIDRASWPRRHHLRFFEGFAQPHFQVTSEVEATELVRALRETGARPFPAMLHATTWAANAEEVLRLRLRWSGDDPRATVVLHDVVHPSFTASVDIEGIDHNADNADQTAAPGCDLPLFAYATARYTPDFATFAGRVRAVSDAVRGQPDLEAHAATDSDELIFVSSLPWMSYTSVSHAMMNPQRDSIPRIMWGRFQQRGDRTVVSVSLQVHHGLADGGHVARWFRRVGERLAAPDWLEEPPRPAG